MSDYLFRPVVQNWPLFAQGLAVTVELSVASLVLSLVAGLVLAILQTIGVKPAQKFAAAYIELFRNVPPLVLLFFAFYALPRIGVVLSATMCAVVAMAVYHAGFMAENLRAGIEAVGRPQLDTARALGLTYLQAMRHVVLPQALATIIPPLGNTTISLTKTTALVAAISVPDLMYHAEVLDATNFRTFEIYGAAGAMYLLLVLGIGQVARLLELRLTSYRRALA